MLFAAKGSLLIGPSKIEKRKFIVPHIAKRSIGRSLSVNPIGLGTMPLAIQGRPSEEDAIKVIHAALDSGMDFIDTADVYCLDHCDIGYAERLINKALKTWKRKNQVLVATKGGLERPNGSWTVNAHPKHLKSACEASLKALDVDCITLYQLHAPDPKIPFSDSIGALKELQKEGKIAHIGLSNVSVAELQIAQKEIEIVSVQNRCNPFDLSAFHDGTLAFCEQNALAFLPYSPMGGSYQKHLIPKNKVLIKIATAKSATPYQIVLAWFLHKSPVLIPIPGASRIESAQDSAAAMHISLSPAEITEIDHALE